VINRLTDGGGGTQHQQEHPGGAVSRILEVAQRSEVERLCGQGEAHAAAGESAEALACFLEAWELLPEPREEYLATSDVFRGFTRVLRARGDLGGGLELLLSARSRFAPVLAAMGWRSGGD
jgi:hypothetical protein